MSRVIFFSSITLIFLLFSGKAAAQVMQQEKYRLEFESFTKEDNLSPSPQESQPQITPQVPRFDYEKYSQKSLGITLSPGILEFGIIQRTSPVTRAVKIIPASSGDFFLYTYIDHSLMNENGDSIPQTSCDDGTCTETVAGLWENTLTFGLGYSCNNKACDNDFRNNKYRPFSLLPVHFANYKYRDDSGEILMPVKLNAQATQPPGNYQNSINILAVPKL